MIPQATDRALWDELATLAADPKGERALLARAFAAWCAARGVAHGALYLESERGWRRENAVGSGTYPVVLPKAPRDLVPHQFVPGAVLLVPPGGGATTDPSDDPLRTLLATAIGLTRARAQLKQQHFQVNYRVVELEALYDVGLAIAGTLDLQALSEEILLRAVSLIDARRGALYLLEGSLYRLRGTIGGSAFETLDPVHPQVIALAAGADAADLVPGATHVLGLPIETDNRAAGLLVVADKESRDGVGPFADNDRRTLSLFANQAAIALENAQLHLQALEKERLEGEMALAADIQRRILPKGVPDVYGFELAGWYRPARQVGGDYFDFVRLPEGRLAVTVGDVSGKGVPAALMVSTLHSALRLLLDRVGVGSDLLGRLNQHIVESSTPNKFITLFLGEIDPESATFSWLNAGHNPGIIVRANGEVAELPAGGLPLGLLPGSTYRAEAITLAPGDLVCLYSDGITEAEAPNDEQFGEERLIELLRRQACRPLDETTAALGEAVREFAASRPQADDQTIVLVRRQ